MSRSKKKDAEAAAAALAAAAGAGAAPPPVDPAPDGSEPAEPEHAGEEDRDVFQTDDPSALDPEIMATIFSVDEAGEDVEAMMAPAAPEPSEAAAVWEKVDDFNTWGRNPRVISEEDVNEAVTSFLRFGFGNPMVGWSKNRTMYAGHARRLGVKKLLSGVVPYPQNAPPTDHLWTCKIDNNGLIKRDSFRFTGSPGASYVPIRWCDWPTESEAEAYGLRDNNPLGADDEDLLRALIQDFDAQGVSFEGVGVDEEELAELRKGAAEAEANFEAEDLGGEDSDSADRASKSGAEKDTSGKLANVGFSIGPYRILIERARWDTWHEELRQTVGFSKEEILAEVRRRLGL